MLNKFIKFVILLMVLEYSSTEQGDQIQNNEIENLTESNQEDTSIPNSPVFEDNTDNPVDNGNSENSTEEPKLENEGIPEQEDTKTKSQVGAKQNKVVDQISSLSEQILDLIELFAGQNNLNSGSPKNSTKRHFLLSFMTEKSNDSLRKMTVNNNYKGTNIVPTQVYVEKGSGSKQPASPNIQMTIPCMNQQQQQQNNAQNQRNQQVRNDLQSGQLPYPYQQHQMQG